MRKSSVVLLAGLCFLMTNLTVANAWLFGNKKSGSVSSPEAQGTPSAGSAKAVSKTEAQQAAEKARADKVRDEEFKAKRAAAQRKLSELNNTEWTVEMVSIPPKAKKEVDTITFSDNKVSIAGYLKKGFPNTNFTLTVQEDGSVIWETMQTSEKSGIAFWRGELDARMQTMRGVVSYQVDKKTKYDYSFNSTAKKNIPSK